MIPAAFDYRRRPRLDDALRPSPAASAKVLAGGMSLLPLMKLRLARPRARRHRPARRGQGRPQARRRRLAIGALTTYAERHRRHATTGCSRDALPRIGDIQVRNRGTVGGAIAHADPASDLPACLLALDAELVARSATRRADDAGRRLPPGAVHRPASRPDEILTEIRLPGPRDDAGSAY